MNASLSIHQSVELSCKTIRIVLMMLKKILSTIFLKLYIKEIKLERYLVFFLIIFMDVPTAFRADILADSELFISMLCCIPHLGTTMFSHLNKHTTENG